jgi:hypothetical protein
MRTIRTSFLTVIERAKTRMNLVVIGLDLDIGMKL